ncbi:formate dehydrogenase accessory sulfurtransferase FdhD [Motiliproteus coralliicola]|uniref:formate dehydrogenase accessory sulfurtransferase FdhD n=1 Tax=Motiliproteus coralliicola TaxID=2283196 RepID=UPI001FB5331C|nr:formate dehydrogenase accessory sulfurtransferase FdhD [Motiliproteus coralliicola]
MNPSKGKSTTGLPNKDLEVSDAGHKQLKPTKQPSQAQQHRVRRWNSERPQPTSAQDWLAEETPVALCYNSVCHLVMMVTPDYLEDFALGFSLSEGILESPDQLYGIDIEVHEQGIEVNLEIAARQALALKAQKRNLTGRTGCGLCGTDSLEHANRQPDPVAPTEPVTDEAIQQALSQLNQHQPMQQLTGAFHGAAWCNRDGEIQLLREDVGRHNALDKLIGALAVDGFDPQQGFVLISSRASYEMVQKTASAGISQLVAVSAPTALAVRLAEQTGVKLTGFARDGSHVHYCHL